MKISLSPQDLIDFEQDIAQCFAAKQIRHPVHFSGGNERQLIEVFEKHVEPEDWVLCGWRSHLHCLLKGVPPKELKQAIVDGHSIALCFPEYKILSSAIVGGVCPIAVGLAMGIKRKGEWCQICDTSIAERATHNHGLGFKSRKVVCFIGDMTAETGICYESMKYAMNHQLPVLWVVEDNSFSVRTPTNEAWGGSISLNGPSVVRYNYVNTYPHCGLDKWVAF